MAFIKHLPLLPLQRKVTGALLHLPLVWVLSCKNKFGNQLLWLRCLFAFFLEYLTLYLYFYVQRERGTKSFPAKLCGSRKRCVLLFLLCLPPLVQSQPNAVGVKSL